MAMAGPRISQMSNPESGGDDGGSEVVVATSSQFLRWAHSWQMAMEARTT